MMQKLAVLFSIALLASACAAERPQAVFELDAAGGAGMLISEGAQVAADEAQLRASADETKTVTLTGSITDDGSISLPDYTLKTALQGEELKMVFDVQGIDVSSLVSSFGQFSVDAKMRVSDGKLIIEASGTMDKRMLSEMFMIEPQLAQGDLDGFKSDFQDSLNELFALMPVETTPRATVTEFGLSGEGALSFTLKMEISDWGALLPPDSNGGASDFMSCLGIDTGDMMSSALASGSDTVLSISASGDKLSGSAEFPVPSFGRTLQSMSLDTTKSGAKTDIRGSLKVADSKALLSCMAPGYLPGYVMGRTDFTLAKARGGAATMSVEADIAGLAAKSGEDYAVSFPAQMTSAFDVKVKIPSSLSILSVEGGKASGDAADSEAGKDFKVTYGKGGKMDMTLIIILIVVAAAVAALFLIRNYNLKKRGGGGRPQAPHAPRRHVPAPPAGPSSVNSRL